MSQRRSIPTSFAPKLRGLGAVVLAFSLIGVAPVSARGPVALVVKGKSKAKKRRAPAPKKDVFTAEMAAAEREEANAVAGPLLGNGEFKAAGIAFDGAAARRGDPILYLQAGDAYLEQAKRERDPATAEVAIERGAIALDILYFQLDDASDEDFRVVGGTEIPGLITRAEELQTAGRNLIDEIEQERAAAAAAAAAANEEPQRKRKVDAARAATISGAVLTSLGGVMLGVGVAGVGLGAVRQREAEDPTVYGNDYDAVADKGERANLIAYVGLSVGAVFMGAGIAALVVGARKKKKAGQAPSEEARVRWSPQGGPRSAGMSVSGRF